MEFFVKIPCQFFSSRGFKPKPKDTGAIFISEQLVITQKLYECNSKFSIFSQNLRNEFAITFDQNSSAYKNFLRIRSEEQKKEIEKENAIHDAEVIKKYKESGITCTKTYS